MNSVKVNISVDDRIFKTKDFIYVDHKTFWNVNVTLIFRSLCGACVK